MEIADRGEALLDVAALIIQENGDFDLPMRELAARAQVSLRTPYELFGSKAGIIRALLKRDQARWRERLKDQPRGDRLDRWFGALAMGVVFFGERPAFYRALFRATLTYSGGPEPETSRERPERYHDFCRVAIREGRLRSDIDPVLLGEALLDVFAANIRLWAGSGLDLETVELRVGFSWALLLAGAARDDHRAALEARARSYQARMISGPSAGAPPLAAQPA